MPPAEARTRRRSPRRHLSSARDSERHAPADGHSTAAPPKPALSELIPQALRGIADANAAHDTAKSASFLADDIALYFYGSLGGSERHGKSDVADRFKKTPFSDIKDAPSRIWMKGNVAVVEFTWTGTMTGDVGTSRRRTSPSGRSV